MKQKTVKTDKWIVSGDSLIPNALYKSYKFQARYFPKTHVLQVEEKGKYYDDHAIIQFIITDMDNVEKVLNSITWVATI